MSEPDFNFEINERLVSVRLNGTSPRGRFWAFIFFFIALPALGTCALLFLPGRNGSPSMWQDLSSSGPDIFACILLLSAPPFMLLLIWRYAVSAYPSDEVFRCDGSTLTISKVRWFDFQNNDNWSTRSYALPEIETMRYKAIASARATSIYGLWFKAGGRIERVLPGLEPREADKILKAVKRFGVNVPDDPKLLRKLAEQDSQLASRAD